jgi:hypothetical protein
MKITLQETGKSIQAFANVVTTIIFLKHFWDYHDLSSMLMALVIWFGLYFTAIGILILSEKIKE